MKNEYNLYLRNCLALDVPPLSPNDWIREGKPTSPKTETKEISHENVNKNVVDAFSQLMQNNKELANMRLAMLEEKRWAAVNAAVERLK